MNGFHVHEIFILMGLILVISFLASSFFRSTRIPNPIVLIVLGIGLHAWKNSLDLSILQSLAPAFGSFALLLILLEAGLDFDIRNFFKSIGPAVLFGTSYYLLGDLALYWLLKSYFHNPTLPSILLALVSVGCSPSILMPILKGMSFSQSQKAFLDLECNVTEVLGLVLTLCFIPFLLQTLQGQPLLLSNLIYASGYKLFHIIVIALCLPVTLGMVWSRLLSYAGERPLWPILTIGITLLLYGASESWGGKGALNVLLFGLVVGNARIIRAFFVKTISKLKLNQRVGELFLSFFVGQNFAKVQHISREFSFFVRTFFFVYLGAIVEFSQFNLTVTFVVCAITFVPMLVRFALAFAFRTSNVFELPSLQELVFLTPRGLANVILVFAILDFASRNTAFAGSVSFLRETLVPPVFGVIMLSNIIVTGYLILRKPTPLKPLEPSLDKNLG
jgi:cell volume regulation protein A